MTFTLVLLMYAIWSSVFPLGKLALENSPPLFLTGVRMTFAGTILLTALLCKGMHHLRIKKEQLLPLFALSIFSIYLSNALEFWGLKHLSAAKTCFIYGLSPFFAALFSLIHFGERMTWKKLLGMVIGFTGFIPVLMLQTGSEGLLSAFGLFSWPEIAIMGAALFAVYGWILLRIIVKSHTLSPLFANGYSMLFGGIIALLHSFFMEPWTPTPVAAGREIPFIQGICVVTFISNIVCYNLYGFMLRKYTATFLSFCGLLSPLFASLTSYILLGEIPS